VVLNFMATIYAWLEANPQSMKIERWFVFISYTDIANPNPADPTTGVSLFDGPDSGAGLIAIGL